LKLQEEEYNEARKKEIKRDGICERHYIYFRNINSKFYCSEVPKQDPVALMVKAGWNNEGRVTEVGILSTQQRQEVVYVVVELSFGTYIERLKPKIIL
jgi:hypothetical protein